MDTLALAARDRKSQGPCEVEISYGGEFDLHRALVLCDKNPGHRKFIPVEKFTIDHLPPLYQHGFIAEAVRAVFDITVRLAITFVSDKRPHTFPDTDKPFPCYDDRGSDQMRVGSGWLDFVEIYQGTYKEIQCKCFECKNSGSLVTKFAKITIKTAAHVVYDKLEGQHTTCQFFFDRGDSPDVCEGVLSISRATYVTSDAKNDTCILYFYIHDLDLAFRLKNLYLKYKDTHLKVAHNWYDEHGTHHPSLSDSRGHPDEPLTVIVSHPHGCSKQISIGQYTKRLHVDNIYCQYIYNTATCPGSSGAPVYVVPRLYMGCANPHNGNCEEDKKLNYSGASEF